MSKEDNTSVFSLTNYEARKHIYTARVKGKYRNLKWLAMVILLGIYYTFPFLRYERGENAPDQAVLIDMAGRKFYFFMIEVWPQEVYYFTGILLMLALLLFLATSIGGRMWCGYACPQTVWTDLYMMVERLVEGDRHRRMRRDKSPLTFNKFWLKSVKHVIWLFIALATGGAWVLYFNDAPTLIIDLLSFNASGTAIFWILFLTATTYLFAGHGREQICTYACPYARFQGAMFDNDTLIVTYDEKRGEPRGKKNKGDCIDCGRCTAVCPTGIDIREGQQYQCITCALCVDACNEIMAKIGKPQGLIRYDTDSRMAAHAAGKDAKFRIIRPRTIIYGSLFFGVGFTVLYNLINHPMLDINVIRDRNPLFTVMSDGSVRNIYTVKVINKGHDNKTYTLKTSNLNAKLSVLNNKKTKLQEQNIFVKGNSVGSFKVFMDIPYGEYKSGSNSFNFNISDGVNFDSYTAKFVAPKED